MVNASRFYLRRCTFEAGHSKRWWWSGRTFPQHALASRRHLKALTSPGDAPGLHPLIPTSTSHPFPFCISQTLTTRRRNCMHHGCVMVEDGPRGLPRVCSLAPMASNEARCSSLETACTRTTRDTRRFCLNTELPPIVDLTKNSIQMSAAEDCTRLPSSHRSTENVHSRPGAAKLSH